MAVKLLRVTQGEDYRRIMRTGHRVGGPIVVTHAVLRTTNEPARFGFIVSKKVGGAVVRNLVTRRLKAIAHDLTREGCIGYEIVFRAGPEAATATFAQLDEAVRDQVNRVIRRSAS